MENNPTAPAEAPKAPESVETPTTNTETTAAPQAPDMHGFTSEQLADMKKFFDNNGGFDAIKSKISNPQTVQAPEAQKTEPTSQPQAQPVEQQPVYRTPEGSITAQEFMAKQYFQSLASEEKYAPIAKGIANGDYLKEMAAFGINATNPDGSINDQKVRMYLDLKAQTVPAQPTSSEPNMSNAPTVEYVQVSGDKITNMQDAYRVLAQDIQLKKIGQSHPLIEEAEKFIKTKGKVDKK